jgi:hypothetical protein
MLAVRLRFLRLRVSKHKIDNKIIIIIIWKTSDVTLEYCCTSIDGEWRRKVVEPNIRFQRSVMQYAFHRRHHWIRLSYGRILPVVQRKVGQCTHRLSLRLERDILQCETVKNTLKFVQR